MIPPRWATELVAAVCGEAGVIPPGRLLWRERSGAHSTGVARRADGVIAVRAGTDAVDQRLTLLHELAHWITPWPRRRRGRVEHHGRAFYATAFRLYARHEVTAEDALQLESARYASALRHATALGVAGARDALADRRRAQRERPRRVWRVVVPEHAVRLERDGRWTVCAVCRQRIVGRNLVRARRARLHHTLFAAA
jgi:hypothetical protein